jgi:hypothetical protein
VSPSGKPDHNDPKYTLTVRSTSGEFTDEFNKNNKAEKVLDVAIDRLHLEPKPPYPYVLVRKTPPEKTLNLQDKLEDNGVRDGDLILVQTSEAEDG